MATHGSSTFTCVTILLLSSLIVATMINRCNGFLASSNPFADWCNGTMGAECLTSLVEDDEEFLMDTEEHRRILQGGNNYISYNGLQSQKPFCNKNGCAGNKLYSPGRKCTMEHGCH
ncbi:hypothetical protein L6452_44446 [Arctium lappa]|uniref:Uncharacterized protein n=1 Tax=Arctium lappa TaxID=4217 RepID=A0ACB8XFX1_ARCLA|nr:hypothetical protein L6452_44446 [Arctium lappa]